LLIRYWQTPKAELWQNHLAPFSAVFVVWIIIFYIAGLYNLRLAVNNANFFRLTARSLGVAGLLSLAFFYLTPQINIAPKRNLLIYIAVFFIIFYLWRRLYNSLLKSYLPKSKIAIIGLNNLARELVEEFNQKPHLGYRVAFVIDGEENTNALNNIPIIKDTNNLENLIKEKNIDTIVFADSPRESDELRTSLFECLPLKINYISLHHFYENITGKIPVESINKMWFLENLSEGRKNAYDAFKRFCDIMLALCFLIITIIFWPFIALIIKLESEGPVFFKQARAGKNNTPFKILKFRSMANAENDYSPTISNDKRVTKFGSILRKTRIDELPQIINILKGEMSFIGPRPERPELIEGLEKQIPFYKERMLVKPGATGWDQISGEYHSPSYEDSLKKIQYDLFYIKNRSVYLDLSIILKTVTTVLSREGV
jgi:exopolysaccharide biosynthesis polyprenyl glycosylphosphotransferase